MRPGAGTRPEGRAGRHVAPAVVHVAAIALLCSLVGAGSGAGDVLTRLDPRHGPPPPDEIAAVVGHAPLSVLAAAGVDRRPLHGQRASRPLGVLVATSFAFLLVALSTAEVLEVDRRSFTRRCRAPRGPPRG